MVEMFPGWQKYALAAGIIVGIMVLCTVVSAATFNLTCTQYEKYLLWNFDNDTYNISIDGSNATAFTGDSYLVTNLQTNTMHMISIENATNSTTDYCTTRPLFWDSDYFKFLILAIFFGLISFKWPWFAFMGIIVSIFGIGVTVTSGLPDYYLIIMAGVAGGNGVRILGAFK